MSDEKVSIQGIPIRITEDIPPDRIGLEGPRECAFIDVAKPEHRHEFNRWNVLIGRWQCICGESAGADRS